MFTFNIRNITNIGKGEMKWDASLDNKPKAPEISSEQKSAEQALQAFNEYKGKDNIVLSRLLGELHSANDAFAKKNATESLKIDTALAASIENETDPEKKRILQEMQKKRADKLAALAATVSTGKTGPKDVIIAATQEKSSVLRGSVGLTSQTEAMQLLLKEFSAEKGNESLVSILKGLKDVNIVSLLGVAKNIPDSFKRMDYDEMRKIGYSADGIFGSTELSAANDFLQEIAKNPNFKAKIMTLAAYADAGLDPTVALRGDKQIDKLDAKKLDTIVEYFGDVPSGRYSKNDIITTLNTLKGRKDFITILSGIANIPGVTTVEGLITAIKADPAAKARFFDNINASAATGIVGLKNFLTGNGVENAETFVQEFKNKAKQAQDSIDTVLNNPKSTPEEKKNAQAAKDAIDKKGGSTWLTGEIQKVAQAAFFNIGKDANAIGAGLTYEAFVKGLTVTIGAALSESGQILPSAVVHYGVSGKLGETASNIVSGTVGIGSSIFPVAIPFIDGGVSLTDKITTLGTGIGGVNTIGVHAQWMTVGGVMMLSRTNEHADEIAQGQAKLMSSISEMARLPADKLTTENISKLLSTVGLQATPKYLELWTNRMKEVYRVNGVNEKTSPETKVVLLSGLVQSEVEKSWVQEAQNDRDAKSFKGGMIGIGHIFGVTFPVGGLLWKEGNMKYGASRVVETVTETKKDIKFSDLYAASTDGNTWTFKLGEKPKTIVIDPSVGTYDAENGTIVFKDAAGVKVSKITTTPDGKLDTITIVQEKEKASEGSIRSRELSKHLQGSIYYMNRNEGGNFVSFNKAISFISDGKYTEAYTLLNSKRKESSVIDSILKELDSDKSLATNPNRLTVLLSYTYGAKDVKNKNTDISSLDYKNAHSQAVQNAEIRLDPKRWNSDNEVIFSQIEKHTSKPLSQIIAGQDLSVSVYATPLRGAHRIDKYEGSLSVSDKLSISVNDAQKDALITEHSTRIRGIVAGLKSGITEAGKDASLITEESYKEMLKTGAIPASWKSLGLSFDKSPVFFEARAMAAGNICMNKTEGIGYPTFKSLVDDRGITHIITRLERVVEQDVIGGTAGYSEVVTGVFGTALDGKREPEVKKEEVRTEIQTRDVQVSPTNIQTIDGNRVIVINTGGTQTNVPLTSLTRAQAISLSQGQSITLNASINVPVQFTSVTPGTIVNRAPEAVVLMGSISTIEVQSILSTMLADPRYKFADDKKK